MTDVSRDDRRCALQVLYQLDLLDDPDVDSVIRSLEDGPFSAEVRARGADLAVQAWSGREELDRLVSPCSPDWPTHRQPVIDRNILRISLHEITKVGTPGNRSINDAVELAKEYGTEKSPAFINAVLDRIWKTTLQEGTPRDRA